MIQGRDFLKVAEALIARGTEADWRSAARLNSRRGERNQADYDLDRNIDQTTAATQVRSVEDIIRVFESVATEPLKTQVTDAIKVYERDVLREVTWHA